MHDYILYGAITLVLSTVFSMGGAGSGIALIPVLHFLGLDFTVAKAVGLFAGASTTITSSIMNIKRKAVEYAFVLPIAVTMLLFAPLGAYSSSFINENIVKFFFMLLLFYSATMMMFGKKKALFSAQSKLTLLLVGAVVGFIAGLLGVGGGNILIPLLALLGFAPKKVAVAVSFVVPFSALGSFFTYASYVPLDWVLLAVVALCAIIGGYIGNYLMHFKLEQSHIKKIMAALLYLLALKMLFFLTFP
ncbi:sulfite exporter TauE/SafE family protein [Sulfurimonas sp. SWIR-19]|uniref:sulfite exporter TauE/SafE family protein n=1 Tax=Sulfurimonas sp. SWIR-19 TaxID=2878390 RepID=UPI001CF4CAC4|nr:sulfite exporter TauE/SafE family protein [Sulfurimonas sp. SWIR-19]UCN01333.1 sulfite exporter TauE/SafE family protein [Sulfurimonas sp. SWIR-19]